jgi:hypothetical protein
MLDVVGEIHRGHPTATDLPLDGVAVGEGCFEAVQLIGQAGTSAEAGLRYGSVDG